MEPKIMYRPPDSGDSLAPHFDYSGPVLGQAARLQAGTLLEIIFRRSVAPPALLSRALHAVARRGQIARLEGGEPFGKTIHRCLHHIRDRRPEELVNRDGLELAHNLEAAQMPP